MPKITTYEPALRPRTVSLGARVTGSDQFKATFRDGMALVSRTASYLDGDGRAAARGLSQSAALVYANESMKLTTRLMQIASWLLMQRALHAGEITADQAQEQRTKMELASGEASRPERYETLPDGLRELIDESFLVAARVLRLDALIYRAVADDQAAANALAPHMARLRAMYGGE